jgi:hypothetical protein
MVRPFSWHKLLMTPGEPQADDDNVRCQWGSQSWLQPAFSRPLPGTTARSSPESRLKGVPRGDPRARLPAPRLFSSKALPCASAGAVRTPTIFRPAGSRSPAAGRCESPRSPVWS